MAEVTTEMLKQAKWKLNHPDEISLVELLAMSKDDAAKEIFAWEEYGEEWRNAWSDNSIRRVKSASIDQLIDLLSDPSAVLFKMHKSWLELVRSQLILRIDNKNRKIDDYDNERNDLINDINCQAEKISDYLDKLRSLRTQLNVAQQRIDKLEPFEITIKTYQSNARKYIREALNKQDKEKLESGEKYILLVFGKIDGEAIIKQVKNAYAKSLPKGDTRDIRPRTRKTISS